MAVELDKISFDLIRHEYRRAGREVADLRCRLDKEGLLPNTLQNGNAMTPDETIGTWLRRLTKKRKLSQRQLAQRTGVNHSSISRIFREDRMPTLPVFTKIVTVLGINSETILEVMKTVSKKEPEQHI